MDSNEALATGLRRRGQPTAFALRRMLASINDLDRSTLVLGIYQQLRGYVEHEDELTNARISRTLLLHGFLFAAYGLLVQATTDVLSKPLGVDKSPCVTDKLQECMPVQLQTLLKGSENLLLIVAMTGVVTSIGAVIGVHAASSAIKRLATQWKDITKDNKALVERLHLPDITGGGGWRSRRSGAAATLFVPYAVSVMWLLVVWNTVAPLGVSPLFTLLRNLSGHAG